MFVKATDMSNARLERARKGDPEAFAEVFEELRPSVFAVASRVAGPDDAEDVTMQAFLRAWQALPEFQGRASLKSWLYRIAYNCALDQVRRRRRSPEVQLAPADGDAADAADPLEELPDEHTAAPSARLEAGETQAHVRRALARLPDEHRVALELRYSDGLSYAEIAAATGVSIGTVMSRLFNAKRKLQRALAELDQEADAGGRRGGG
jgi:RNA polymerase sigma-70 factor (ECF subfamily)